jgi:DNA-binding Lrp family transcriptional regulator
MGGLSKKCFMEGDFKNLLLGAGLNEIEIAVYMCVLKNPTQTKWEIVNQTKIDKNKVYRACERLQELHLITKYEKGICAKTLSGLIQILLEKQQKTTNLIKKLSQHNKLISIPTEKVEEIEIATCKNQILEQHEAMAEREYNTCLDFGDFEEFVPVLGGIDHVFRFRKKRFGQNAKNIAICAGKGPFTSCMSREKDMKKYKSTILSANIKTKNKWVIFSDTSDYLMINDFSDKENPAAATIKSKHLADTYRKKFARIYKKLKG